MIWHCAVSGSPRHHFGPISHGIPLNLRIPAVNYQTYLETDYWKQVSTAVKERAEYRCQVCNSPHDLQAHHRTYEHRGRELGFLGDLICLCRRCHGIFHGKAPEPKPVPVQQPKLTRKQRLILEAADPELEDMDLVTEENYRNLSHQKQAWHWYKAHGIRPEDAGWMRRCIGREVPCKFIYGPAI